MKRDSSNKVRGMMMIAVLTLITAGACAAQESRGGRLVGTWDTKVRLKNCTTGNVDNTFDSIGSFNQGGTSIGSTSGIPQSARTPEHGIWRHVTGNVYQFKFKTFSFNAPGPATGYAIIEHTVELDSSGETYYSDGTAKFYAMNGTLMGQGCSDADGVRMTF